MLAFSVPPWPSSLNFVHGFSTLPFWLPWKYHVMDAMLNEEGVTSANVVDFLGSPFLQFLTPPASANIQDRLLPVKAIVDRHEKGPPRPTVNIVTICPELWTFPLFNSHTFSNASTRITELFQERGGVWRRRRKYSVWPQEWLWHPCSGS